MSYSSIRRAVARVAVFGVTAVAVISFANRSRPTPTSASGAEVALELAPLWRQPADVLDRPVRSGPWRARAVVDGPHSAADELLRWNRVFTYARRYRISMELARQIHDIALEEKIEPELAFRLVRLESRFDPNVISSAGAIGLTQLMLGTARYFQPGVTAEALTDPATNLRIGFRYLRGLVREHRGDLRLALLTYNRGPAAVQAALASGEDPANGYDRILMRGYRGRGVID
ncbi:MAG TPA: transglycosylase SLT domain-containing protein [Gemmatimonadaceae bacterium]|nr:transglycosylase SLT domain-containing protein [Gemmatimonadaceae bacterium]